VDREQVLFRLFGKYCREGTILYAEGAPGEELFVVQSGAVRVGAAGGGEAPKVLGPGGILGEECFFGRAPRAARAEVVKDSRLLQVSDRTLDAVARQGPEVARTVTEGLLELAGAEARRLEAAVLSRLALRAEPHLRTVAPLSPEELAELSGLSVRDCRAVLEALAERSGLSRAAAGYLVTDVGALERSVLAMAAAANAA
jgi:CRP-like cAMP-binding protein